MKLCITGANSSVGRNLLQHLAERDGVNVVALVRAPSAFAVLPRAANIEPLALSYEDHTGLLAACRGAQAIVHLAGVLFESRRSSYHDANVVSTAAVVSVAQQAGVPHVVFVSVLGADPASRNPFYRTKGQAEQLVTGGSGLAATVLRTPLLLGPDSAGGRALLREARSGKAKLLGGGRHEVRPLDVDDLSAAILAACANPGGSRVLELCGPERTPYHALVTRVAGLLGHKVEIGSVPLWLVKILSRLSHGLKRGGMSPAIIDVITASEDVRENADAALGLSLTPLGRTLEKLTEAKG